MVSALPKIRSLRPIRDRVVVRMDKAEERSKGGIIMTEGNASKLDRVPCQKATVLHVGPGRTLNNGVSTPMTVKPGDRVLVDFCRGAKVDVNGEELVICYEEDIVSVFDPEAQILT